MSATVQQLNVSAGGVPKKPVAEVRVRKDGIDGDAHAKTAIHGGPERAVSLFPVELVESLAAEGHPIAAGGVGENVTTRGLEWRRVIPGTRLRLGAEVQLEIVDYASPCQTIRANFSDGDVTRLSQRVAPGQSRVCARVLREGTVHAGDEIVIEREGDATLENEKDKPAPPQRRKDVKELELAYVNLYVSDLARSLEFFEKTLGLELQYADESFGYASFDAGPLRMGIARVDPSDEKGRALLGRQTGFGFGVRDLEAVHKELASRGVEFTMEPTRQPWGGFMAMFADPDGNVFYLDQVGDE